MLTTAQDIGLRLRNTRRSQGWTQHHLAAEINNGLGVLPVWTHLDVQAWEDGTAHIPPDVGGRLQQLFGRWAST